MDLDPLARRIRAEFLEMPGLRLSMPQAARLWGLDAPTCDAVVTRLEHDSFLRRTDGGIVTRVDR